MKALLLGYLLFCVNGRYFLRYDRALTARENAYGEILFTGWHITRGWECFYVGARYDVSH
jgi:hypothetical protein